MCSNLGGLFACIRAQGSSESDFTSTTHKRNDPDLDDDATDSGNATLRLESSKNVPLLKKEQPARTQCLVPIPVASRRRAQNLPAFGGIRPLTRDFRISYEAMERHDQVYGNTTNESAGSSSRRNMPDQF